MTWNGQPARPTTYCGVQMRSRMEAQFAEMMDRCGVLWEYEPRCFASPEGQYLPDFAILAGGKVRYVETKPCVDDPTPIQQQMTIIRASEPDASLWLFDLPNGRSWLSNSPADGWRFIG